MSDLEMPAPSIGVESYMHRAAKEVMARWLREAAQLRGGMEWAALSPVQWRPNRAGPCFGVWLEYPFTWDWEGHGQVWDECNDPRWHDRAPTVAEIAATGLRPSFVADIALQHKGMISAVVEIVHKHPPSPAKRAFYADRNIALYPVRASWVLSQVARPAALRVLP